MALLEGAAVLEISVQNTGNNLLLTNGLHLNFPNLNPSFELATALLVFMYQIHLA